MGKHKTLNFPPLSSVRSPIPNKGYGSRAVVIEKVLFFLHPLAFLNPVSNFVAVGRENFGETHLAGLIV